MIQGRSVNLRFLTMNDMPYLVQWYQDSELMLRYDRLPVYNSSEIQEEMTRNINSDKRLDFMVITKTDQPIGMIYLDRIDWKNRHCEQHTMIAEKGKRNLLYGPETAFLMLHYAFTELNMHKVYGRIVAHARQMKHFMEKIGFQKEVVQKKLVYQNGRYWDRYIYGILYREYDEFLNSKFGRRYKERIFSRKNNLRSGFKTFNQAND